MLYDVYLYVQLLESHIKNEIIEKSQLVRTLPNIENRQSNEPLTSMSIACGASTFEVWMTLPKWAAQVGLLHCPQEYWNTVNHMFFFHIWSLPGHKSFNRALIFTLNIFFTI
jgi:hypothetical protein